MAVPAKRRGVRWRENPECLELVLRFRVSRAPAEDVRNFTLDSGLRAAHWLTHPAQFIEILWIQSIPENAIKVRVLRRGPSVIVCVLPPPGSEDNGRFLLLP